jgi:hypothetical protein
MVKSETIAHAQGKFGMQTNLYFENWKNETDWIVNCLQISMDNQY